MENNVFINQKVRNKSAYTFSESYPIGRAERSPLPHLPIPFIPPNPPNKEPDLQDLPYLFREAQLNTCTLVHLFSPKKPKWYSIPLQDDKMQDSLNETGDLAPDCNPVIPNLLLHARKSIKEI